MVIGAARLHHAVELARRRHRGTHRRNNQRLDQGPVLPRHNCCSLALLCSTVTSSCEPRALIDSAVRRARVI
jgi:hypothetical protein